MPAHYVRGACSKNLRSLFLRQLLTMTYSYERKVATADNSWGGGFYALPPELSHLGRYVANLAPAKLVKHEFLRTDGTFILTTKANANLSVFALDLKTLLAHGLERIQCNEPHTLGFYFGGYYQKVQPVGDPAGGQEGEDAAPALPINRGGWTIWVTKDRATRWGYTLHNPQGGSSSTGSYPSARAAFASGTSRVNWEGADKLLVVIAKWDGEKYVPTKKAWVDIPESGPLQMP